MSEPSEAALAFSDLELDFFRRGDELERSPPARPAAEESMWDWGAEATLTKTRVA